MSAHFPSLPASLSNEFLAKLVTEFDDATVRTIILHGSYARGEAIPPYSDVDLVRIVQEAPDAREHKRFLARGGYLLSISTRPLSVYQQRVTVPEKAIFVVPGIQEAYILLEKDDAFRRFQQEIRKWQWEPLQAAANTYASHLLLEQTEIVLKILRALRGSDLVALLEMITLDLLPAVTDAVAVQQGILVRSGNSYVHQVQEVVGSNTVWTHYYMSALGVVSGGGSSLSLEQRGTMALLLYQETVRFLYPHLLAEHREAIEMVMQMIGDVLQKHIF